MRTPSFDRPRRCRFGGEGDRDGPALRRWDQTALAAFALHGQRHGFFLGRPEQVDEAECVLSIRALEAQRDLFPMPRSRLQLQDGRGGNAFHISHPAGHVDRLAVPRDDKAKRNSKPVGQHEGIVFLAHVLVPDAQLDFLVLGADVGADWAQTHAETVARLAPGNRAIVLHDLDLHGLRGQVTRPQDAPICHRPAEDCRRPAQRPVGTFRSAVWYQPSFGFAVGPAKLEPRRCFDLDRDGTSSPGEKRHAVGAGLRTSASPANHRSGFASSECSPDRRSETACPRRSSSPR